MLEIILNTLVAAGLILLFYHHVAYPLLLQTFGSRALNRDAYDASGSGGSGQTGSPSERWPFVTIIIPAFNEEAFIAEKIRNLSRIDYPSWKAVIALDGCQDRSASICLAEAKLLPPAIHLEIVEYDRNVGKIAVLNDQISRASGDIIALSDTSALLPPDALRRAAAHFRDASVGFVAAAYRLQRPGSEGERAYMAMLRRTRAAEAELHSPLGAHGALYFFRRRLFRGLPPDTINDDFVLPMQIIEQGFRGVYDNRIEAVELETSSSDQEFRRRIRIGAGNLQQTLRQFRLGSPRRPWLAFMFLSGKGLRPFIVFIALMTVAASLVLAAQGSQVHRALLALEVAAVCIGLVAIRLRGRQVPRAMAWIGYLLEGHWASFLGALSYARGKRLASWQKGQTTAREHRFTTIWPPGDMVQTAKAQ